ncbi:MAG TPA: type II secretion system F family protein [Verrucomicrobiales bacterium]|nr:type II secretion system F family protein [Verrucomicrobiales bacterium]
MKFGSDEKRVLYSELGKLLRAGFPLEQALKTLQQQKLPASHRHFIEIVQRGIAEGKSIAESVQVLSPEVSQLEVSLIEAGERGGKLPDVFRQLGDYFHRLRVARQAVVTQLVYPFALFHAGVVLGALPRMFRYGLSMETWGPMVVALAVLYGLLAAVIVLKKPVRIRASRDPRLDGILLKLPLFGRVRLYYALERFCRVFQIYLLAGIRPSRALLAAGEASQSGSVLESAEDMSRQVELGLMLGPLFRLEPVFPQDFAVTMATAEEAGTLDEELGRWARLFTLQGEEALEQLKVWLPRAIYFCIVIYMAWLILSMGLGYVGMFEEMLGE